MNFSLITVNNRHILYDQACFEDPGDISFDSSCWARRDAIVGFAEGRGTTFFVNYHGQELALRHYHRGGLVARWSPDRYLWTGLQSTRAWKELHLLQHLFELNLPVPQPIAAQLLRQGAFYTADIMTRRIAGARSVGQLLSTGELGPDSWSDMGSVIRSFHEQGVYHADLNANNIMLDQDGQFYLIDFDRGAIKRKRRSWQQRNLQRLHRSLVKLKGKHEKFHFSDENWRALLTGYNQT